MGSPMVVDCSPCEGGIENLRFTVKGRTPALWQRLEKTYYSILSRKDEVQDQYQGRQDRQTAELMKRNPDHQVAISKVLARREDARGSDVSDSRTTTQPFPPGAALS